MIALGLPRPDPQRIDALIDLLELGPLANRPVDRLSTGERARVLFARALAPEPRLLLLDEPLSNLDPYWVLRLNEILRDVVASGASALVALHDIDRVEAFDRVLLVAGGEIRADLPPERCSAAGPGRCVPDRARRHWLARQARLAGGGSAIIAVKLASAASLPSTLARPANLHTLERFWTNSTSSLSSTPGSTGWRNFALSIAMK